MPLTLYTLKKYFIAQSNCLLKTVQRVYLQLNVLTEYVRQSVQDIYVRNCFIGLIGPQKRFVSLQKSISSSVEVQGCFPC